MWGVWLHLRKVSADALVDKKQIQAISRGLSMKSKYTGSTLMVSVVLCEHKFEIKISKFIYKTTGFSFT